MGKRFLFPLLALFFLTGFWQQVSGNTVPVPAQQQINACKQAVNENPDPFSSSLEKAELLPTSRSARAIRVRPLAATADRYLPVALLSYPAPLLTDEGTLARGRSRAGIEALFCFLQSLLYPKHSFW